MQLKILIRLKSKVMLRKTSDLCTLDREKKKEIGGRIF